MGTKFALPIAGEKMTEEEAADKITDHEGVMSPLNLGPLIHDVVDHMPEGEVGSGQFIEILTLIKVLQPKKERPGNHLLQADDATFENAMRYSELTGCDVEFQLNNRKIQIAE